MCGDFRTNDKSASAVWTVPTSLTETKDTIKFQQQNTKKKKLQNAKINWMTKKQTIPK